MSRFPLRVTIVLVLLALVTAALLTSGLTATALLRGYLTDRVDKQLHEATPAIAKLEDAPDRLPWNLRGPRLPSTFYVQYTVPNGVRIPFKKFAHDSTPNLPTLSVEQVKALNGRPFNAEDSSGGAAWRVLAVPLRNDAGTVMIAQSLADVNETVGQMVGVQIAVGVILLVLLAGVGTYVVRRSLRGLDDVEHTAMAIAGGDLSRRVPQRDPRTEVGRLSLALNQMLGQIENAFAQRTASEVAARQSEDRMRRFVADASHELRTPLTSIRGFAELTRQRGGPPDPQTMRRIEDEAARMGLLVDDLLLLARLDQQRPPARRPVDLLRLAGDAVHDAKAVQPDRSVSLRILPNSEAPVVAGDEARLRQVLGNLLSNALHHTPVTAPVTVQVGTAGRWAEVSVSDTGPGLTNEQKGRVFERFYRADSARTRSTGGSGLGLSIVAALVAAHGGGVEVTDTPGGGATFTIRLPLDT